jgi:hypothetical protein
MYFLIIADHLLEHAIKKTVIGYNQQNQQLCTIIDNYLINVHSNLTEPHLFPCLFLFVYLSFKMIQINLFKLSVCQLITEICYLFIWTKYI